MLVELHRSPQNLMDNIPYQFRTNNLMSENVQVQGGGIGLGGVLFVVFLVLKLIGVITWSWWWVTAPLWIPFVIIIAVVIVVAIGAGIAALTGR